MKNMFLRLLLRFFPKQFCHYINGPDVLPPPLKREEEQKIMLELADGNDEHKDLLVVHNLRLVVYIARKYECPTATTEDLVSIGTIGLMKAVNTFDYTKNIKLATYASRCIENEILMYLRKTGNSKIELSFDEPLSTDWDGNEMTLRDVLGTEPDEISQNIEYEDEKKLLRKIVSNLPEKEKNIMNRRFGLNGYKALTQKQLADELSISQSYISRLEKRIISNLRKEFDKAHNLSHVRTVIEESLALARQYPEADERLAYVIAAYHDTGLCRDRATHHLVSGEILMADSTLRQWFSDTEILLMKEAVEDHRASTDHEPRSIYGKIVAEADRIIDPDITLRRTVQYGLKQNPAADKEWHYQRFHQHLMAKYAPGGYLKLWFPEGKNAEQLKKLQAIIADEGQLRQVFNRIFEEEK